VEASATRTAASRAIVVRTRSAVVLCVGQVVDHAGGRLVEEALAQPRGIQPAHGGPLAVAGLGGQPEVQQRHVGQLLQRHVIRRRTVPVLARGLDLEEQACSCSPHGRKCRTGPLDQRGQGR